MKNNKQTCAWKNKTHCTITNLALFSACAWPVPIAFFEFVSLNNKKKTTDISPRG